MVLQMDKFGQIGTELWPLIDVIKGFFFTLYVWHFFTDFLQTCMKRSIFKMIFFSLKISSGGICCMPAALLLSKPCILKPDILKYVHLVFCAVLIYIFSYSLDVELRYIVSPNRYVNIQSVLWRCMSRAGVGLVSEYERICQENARYEEETLNPGSAWNNAQVFKSQQIISLQI